MHIILQELFKSVTPHLNTNVIEICNLNKGQFDRLSDMLTPSSPEIELTITDENYKQTFGYAFTIYGVTYKFKNKFEDE